MLSPKQIKMLDMLDKMVRMCRSCQQFPCGPPSWSYKNKYAIINVNTLIDFKTMARDFSNFSGNDFIKSLNRVGLKEREFMQLGVTCGNTYKPTIEEMDACSKWLRKYLKVLKPEKILCVGNYSKYFFTGNTVGITRVMGDYHYFKLEGYDEDYPVFFLPHPFYFHNIDNGGEIMNEMISKFHTNNKSSLLFSKEDFEII